MAGYTEQQREALQKAIGSGVLTVESPDEGRVTYRSMAEMRQALALVERGLAAQDGATDRPRRTRRVVVVGRSGF